MVTLQIFLILLFCIAWHRSSDSKGNVLKRWLMCIFWMLSRWIFTKCLFNLTFLFLELSAASAYSHLPITQEMFKCCQDLCTKVWVARIHFNWKRPRKETKLQSQFWDTTFCLPNAWAKVYTSQIRQYRQEHCTYIMRGKLSQRLNTKRYNEVFAIYVVCTQKRTDLKVLLYCTWVIIQTRIDTPNVCVCVHFRQILEIPTDKLCVSIIKLIIQQCRWVA